MNFTVLVLLVLLAGVIAYMGDELGRIIGKKRLTVFGIRPKQTAILITILTGIVITFATLGAAAFLSESVRVALTESARISAELQKMSGDLSRTSDEYQKALVEIGRQNQALNQLVAARTSVHAEIARLTAEIELLGSERAELERRIHILKTNDLIYQKDELVGFMTILPGSQAYEIELEFRRYFQDVSKLATRLGFVVRPFEETWAENQPKLKEWAEKNYDPKKKTVILFKSAERVAKGEALELQIKALEDKVVFRKGDVFDAPIDGTKPRPAIKSDLLKFFEGISAVAQQRGTAIDPVTELDSLTLHDLVNKIAGSGKTTRLLLKFTEDCGIVGPSRYELSTE